MSKSPFYKTGISKAKRAERAKVIAAWQEELDTLKNESPEYNKLAAKIDAHSLVTTNLVRDRNYQK